MNIIAWFNILIAGIISGYVAAFVLTILSKWRVFDFYTTHRRPWMPNRVCYFCLGWWFCVAFAIFYVSIMPTGTATWHMVTHLILIPIIGCLVSFQNQVL